MIDVQEHVNDNCNFMIIGDLNSRCGNLDDHVTDDTGAHIPTLPDDYISDVGLLRVTTDKIINQKWPPF